jgi:ABC-type multidrug transport system fused ATPase/permease subunit
MEKKINTFNKILTIFTIKDIKSSIGLFIGMIILGVLEVAGVVSIVPFMAVAANPLAAEENQYLNMIYTLGGFENYSDFSIFLGIVMLSIIILMNGFSAFMKWKITYFIRRYGYNLEMRLMKFYLNQPYIYFLNRNSSDIGKNVLTEVERVAGGIIHPLFEALAKIVVVLFIFITLIVVDPMVAFSVVVFLGGTYVLLFLFVKNKQKEIGVLTSSVIRERYLLVNQIISGIKEIKLRGTEGDYIERYKEPTSNYSKYLAQNVVVSQLPRYALEVLAFGSIILIVIASISQGKTGKDLIPIMSLYVFAGYRLLPSLQVIFSSLTKYKFHLPILDSLSKDLSKSFVPVNFIKSKQKLKLNNTIEINSVNYTYPNARAPSLNNLNLTIDVNTTVGIVGGSGAGKTTLIDLLLGLLPIKSGSMKVDESNITSDNIDDWKNSIGYIPQSIYLTDDTIANNIAFSAFESNVNLQKVINSGKIAMLDQFIDTLPDGYLTMVGERGVRLSGGQIQRIGIARALYDNPDVLIMDEATSALDGITEDLVMQSINNMAHKKTIVIIAHRMSTVKQCDIIHVMDNGSIVDSGSYEYLLENNKKFRRMAKI